MSQADWGRIGFCSTRLVAMTWPVPPSLAQARQRRGLSQEALAELLGVTRTTVAAWERGRTGIYPRNRRKLADVLGIRIEDIDQVLETRSNVGAEPPILLDEQLEAKSSGGAGEIDDGLWQLQAALHPATANTELLDVIETSVGEMDCSFGSLPHERLWANTGQRLQWVTSCLAHPQPVEVRRRLVVLAGQLAGLRGCVLFDQMQHREAMAWFQAGESAAREALDVELAAWLLAHQSLVAYDNGDFGHAQAQLEEGSALAHDGSSVTLQAWVDTLLVRAEATGGHNRSSVARTQAVESSLDQTSLGERRHGMDFDGDQLDVEYYIGSTHLARGAVTEARASFATALHNLPHERRRARAVLALSLASVSAAEDKVDEAAAGVSEVVRLAADDPAGRVFQRVGEVRAALGAQARSISLQTLDDELAALPALASTGGDRES